MWILSGCKPKTTSTTQPVETEIFCDTLKTQEDTQELPQITSRFLSLIQHIDTSGYIFDTLRCIPHEPYKIIQQDKYLLFEIAKETTNPFWAPSWASEVNNSLEDFDIKPFLKTQKVVLYYFKKKQPEIIDGKKWYADGIIEEWSFDNEAEAVNAFNSLKNTDLYIMYFNTGAFICCMNQQLYIFHSRAMAFMYKPQKYFFKWFVQQNNITLKNE